MTLINFLTSKSAIRAYVLFALALVLDMFAGANGLATMVVMGDVMIAGDLKEHEDLSDEIDVLFENEQDMKLLSLVRFLPATLRAMNEKVEWQDDEMPEESISLTASANATDWDTVNDVTALPCTTANCNKLKVGDVLLLPAGSEVTIVKSIDTSGQTIDLIKRGWGGSTATVQEEAAFTAYIIGNAQVDGSDPMTENWRDTTECYNYVQIFEDTAAVSGKIMRSKIGRNSEMARQMVVKLKRLLSQLNYAMLNGVREKASDIATMQGVRDRTTLTHNVGGALTVALIYTSVINMIKAGGSPSAIHGSPETISYIERLLSSFVTSSTSDWHGKLTVKKISLLGIELELHVDKHIVATEYLVVDYNRVSYGFQEGEETGGFKAYEIEKNGKQWKKHVVGYYTMKQKQAAASVMRAYGVTAPA